MREMDVVIPVAPKDFFKLRRCIEGILRCSKNPIRTIHVLSPTPIHLADWSLPEQVRQHGEERFSFTLADVSQLLTVRGCKYPNGSWYYQQLLKLYVFRVIPDLLPDTLILDSDFVFTGEVEFLDEHGRALLALGHPLLWELNDREDPSRHEHVHATFARYLVPGFSSRHAFNGMHHHLLLQRDILEELMALAEAHHQKPFWRAFVDGVDVSKWNAASEYVLYHHFALGRFPGRVATRHLDTCDVIYDASAGEHVERLFQEPLPSSGHQAMGFHGFLDLGKRLQTMDYLSDELRRWMLSTGAHSFALTLEQGRLRIHPWPQVLAA
ncbi:hypothetical protein KYC5002_45415 [Archangium violaceum]|uniref:hypothetical protein n=1 Tax=Archangium violaceum TaxID=83451 RepID=UPI002B2F5D83|nr:hypothetical protein KYC5002_45415 [Archangium gephyra]